MFRKDWCVMQEINLNNVLMRRPDAVADILGSEKYPEIFGMTWFYQTERGVLVVTEINGLPKSDAVCGKQIFGCHIHSGHHCSGNGEDVFADTKAHYNPYDCEHPYHAGDMPPLFGNEGYAFSIFLSNRFCIGEIIGRTIVIHLNSDDFHSQPAGNSGMKIACGVISYNR